VYRLPSESGLRFSAAYYLLASGLALGFVGCGGKGLQTRVVHGRVACGGEQVEMGQIRFVPIDGTPGPASVSEIVDGQYRIESRGGVPVGCHRVELTARTKTGRKVMDATGGEPMLVDETILVSPPEYAGRQSPLRIEVTPDSDDPIDIDIPRLASRKTR